MLATLGYAGRASGGRPPSDVLYRYETAISGAVVYLLLLLVVLWIARGGPLRETLALRKPPWWGWLLAPGAYLTILIGAGVLLVLLDAREEQGLTPEAWDSSRAGAYAANFVAVALIGPVVEELLYRGAGLSLLSRFGTPAAVVLTSVAFGLGHGLLLALPALVFFGLVTALLRLRTQSVYPCIVVHCAFNATSLVVAVAA